MYSIFRASKHPQEAFKFIEFVTGLEAQVWLLNGMDRPTTPRLDYYWSAAWQAAVKEKPWMAPMPDIAMSGGPYAFLRFTQVDEKAAPLLNSAITGSISAREAILRMQQSTDLILAQSQ